MIDNTRLSGDQRCAVVMTKFKDGSAQLTLIIFPGSHASLKDRPYYEDVINQLLEANRLTDAEAPQEDLAQ